MPISQIVTNSIANDAVVTADIANGAVTSAKMASGAARSNFGAGAVLQVVSTPKTNIFTTTSTSFVDVTGMSLSITPSSASSRIMIICGLSLGATAGVMGAFPRLMRDSTPIFIPDADGSGIQAAAMFEVGSACTFPVAINFLDSPNTTSAITYKIQLRVNTPGQTVCVNRQAAATIDPGWSRSVSSITAMEIAS